jgi:Zn-dependent protease
MLAAVRQLLRWSFALAAATLLPATVSHLLTLRRRGGITSLPLAYGILAGFLALALLFAMACWTTRKPRATPSAWAIAASCVTLAFGLLSLRYSGRPVQAAIPELFLIAAGLAGILVFARREKLPLPFANAPVSPRIAGDRTSPWGDRAVTLLFCATAYAASRFWSDWAAPRDIPNSSPAASIALILLAVLVTSVLHELGHAVVAWAFRMKLLSFNAGPFQWRWREGRWSFSFQPSGLVTLGGAVSVVPTHARQPRWQDICMILAGPAANLLIGLAVLYATLHAEGSFYVREWEFLARIASFGIIAAVLNLLPFRAQGAYSDGARILQLLTGSPVAELLRSLIGTQTTLVTARRPRELDAEALQRTAELFPQHVTGVHLQLSAAQSYEDAGWIAGARAALAAAESASERFNIDLPPSLQSIFVYGHATLNRDASAARLWWKRMERKPPDRLNVDYWLARTALLWIEGRYADAEIAWQRADSGAAALPHYGAYEYDRSRCARLRRELNLVSPAREPIGEVHIEADYSDVPLSHAPAI